MMAPIFKKVGGQFQDKAVFVKVDTNAQPELSSRYQIRSLPTFQFFVAGQKTDQAVGGIGEQGLIQSTQKVVRQAEIENVLLTTDQLTQFYQAVDPSKGPADVATVHKKCADMTKKFNPDKGCVGAAANQLARRLRQKYKQMPELEPRYDPEAAKSTSNTKEEKTTQEKNKPRTGSSGKPNLHLASKEDLMAELERRLDEERDRQVEEEDENEDEPDPDYHSWTPGDFPERVVIIGGGPAG